MWHDLRYAFRSLSRAPGFAVVAVLTLALGIGANTAVFSLVYSTLLKPLPYRDPSRIVTAWDTYLPQQPRLGVSPPELEAWNQQTDLFEQTAWFRFIPKNLNLSDAGAEAVEVHEAVVSPRLFTLLGVVPALGRVFADAEPPQSVLLSDGLWRTRYAADPAIVGKAIRLNDQPYTVVGVMPPDMQFPKWAELWLPPGPILGDEFTNPLRHASGPLARMRPGATTEQVRTRMETVFRRLAADRPKTSTGFGLGVASLQDDLTASQRPALLLLLGAVALVLLIACVNVANLLLARATSRTKEIALRIALGAGVGRLMRQLLTESALLGVLGGAAGLGLGRAILTIVAPASAHIDTTVLAFTAAVSLLCGALFGLAPAFQLLRRDPNATIKAGSLAYGGSSPLRNLLVVSEIAIALVLVAGAGILVKSFLRLMHVDPGFDASGVLTMRVGVSPTRQPDGLFRRYEERLKTLPGVQAVAVTTRLPLQAIRGDVKRFSVPGSSLINPDALPVALFRFVSTDYFNVLRIPLHSGRAFTERDVNQSVAIVNQALAQRYWPGRDPVGLKLITGPFGSNPSSAIIIGVAGDVRQFGLDSESTMDVYIPDQTPVFFAIRTAGDPAALASAARAALQAVDPEVPVSEVRTMQEVAAESVSARRWTMALLAAFAALALLLALVGIYGMLSWSVAQRSREIGIRMALGARAGDVAWMIMAHVLKLATVGLGVGFAATLALRRALSALVFEVSTADPLIYAGVATLMLASALLAGYVPARRAARVDPLIALRQD